VRFLDYMGKKERIIEEQMRAMNEIKSPLCYFPDKVPQWYIDVLKFCKS
jgi:hypothetical protein